LVPEGKTANLVLKTRRCNT